MNGIVASRFGLLAVSVGTSQTSPLLFSPNSRLVGPTRATEMLMLGEKISAERAEQWGLIYKAVDAAARAVETHALAERLAHGPTLAYGMIRQGIRFGLQHSLMETVQLERRNQLTASRSDDFRAGVEAFQRQREQ